MDGSDLAGMALTGALLTVGLLCRWSRAFPSWLSGFRARQVPLWLRLGLGGSAAMTVWTFGRGMLLGRLGSTSRAGECNPGMGHGGQRLGILGR